MQYTLGTLIVKYLIFSTLLFLIIYTRVVQPFVVGEPIYTLIKTLALLKKKGLLLKCLNLYDDMNNKM